MGERDESSGLWDVLGILRARLHSDDGLLEDEANADAEQQLKPYELSVAGSSIDRIEEAAAYDSGDRSEK